MTFIEYLLIISALTVFEKYFITEILKSRNTTVAHVLLIKNGDFLGGNIRHGLWESLDRNETVTVTPTGNS